VLNMAVLSSSIVVLSGLLSMISGKLLHIYRSILLFSFSFVCHHYIEIQMIQIRRKEIKAQGQYLNYIYTGVFILNLQCVKLNFLPSNSINMKLWISCIFLTFRMLTNRSSPVQKAGAILSSTQVIRSFCAVTL
jgi:hypothetical protein